MKLLTSSLKYDAMRPKPWKVGQLSSAVPYPETLGGARIHDEHHPWVGLIGLGDNGWSYATWRKGSFSATGNPGLAYTFATEEAALKFARSFPYGGKKSAKRLTVLSRPTSQGDRYWQR